MADFQFGADIPADWLGLEPAVRQLDARELERYARMIVEQPALPAAEGLAVYPPPITSQYDFPVPLPASEASLGAVHQAKAKRAAASTDVPASTDGLHKPRPKLPWLVSFFQADFPAAPSEEALANMVYIRDTPETLDRLKRLFSDADGGRPIVSRQVAANLTGLRYADLAKILPLLAFCIVDGPYRNCWVRYGTDPRSDPKYRLYQVVTYRSNIVLECPPAHLNRPSNM
jgi:general transcription factor 3C polypeptide 5 (transcription factor C subunit 1)